MWQLKNELSELVKLCRQMLDKTDYFLVINLYSLGFSALILDNVMRLTFKDRVKNEQLGEIYLHDRGERRLPLGTFFRFGSGEVGTFQYSEFVIGYGYVTVNA